MPPAEDILTSLGLDSLIANRRFTRDERTGTLADPDGSRVVCAGPEMMRSFHLVLERERAGAWSWAMKAAGRSCGKKIGADLDAQLAALGKPVLAALPLDACPAFIEHYFALHGWGRLKLDLTAAAEHGVVAAQMETSFLVSVLSDTTGFVDSLLAGMLQGFFEHLSGQPLGCEEIACARHGAQHCAFVITAPERLNAVMSHVGLDNAATIVARLRA